MVDTILVPQWLITVNDRSVPICYDLSKGRPGSRRAQIQILVDITIQH